MKRANITKKHLKDEIYFNFGLPEILSEKLLKSFFDIIVEGLLKDGEVKISKFGNFKILNKKSRIGRNPKTKEEFVITARKSISFKASKNILDKLNF